jgi:hypothetical protein
MAARSRLTDSCTFLQIKRLLSINRRLSSQFDGAIAAKGGRNPTIFSKKMDGLL